MSKRYYTAGGLNNLPMALPEGCVLTTEPFSFERATGSAHVAYFGGGGVINFSADRAVTDQRDLAVVEMIKDASEKTVVIPEPIEPSEITLEEGDHVLFALFAPNFFFRLFVMGNVKRKVDTGAHV